MVRLTVSVSRKKNRLVILNAKTILTNKNDIFKHRNFTNYPASCIRYLVSSILLFVLLGGCCSFQEKKLLSLSENVIREAEKRPRDFDKFLDKIKDLSQKLDTYGISDKDLKKYRNKTINLLYEAIDTVNFHFPQDTRIMTQEKILSEKLRRNLYGNYEIKDMFHAYLRGRMFDKIQDLKGKFPDVKFPSSPETIINELPADINLWRVYRISDGFKKAELIVLPLDKGIKMVLIILTGCSVAERAMKEIMKDDELWRAFKEYGVILTEKFDAEGVSMWKDYFNFSGVYIIHKSMDFPGFNFRSSPVFYLLKDGKIVLEHEGWGEDTLSEIKGFF